MAFNNADRVKETTTTTGTGTYSLAGAATGFITFVAGVGNGNSCHYVVEDGTNWEVGIGTVTDASPDTLSRDRIIASSNAGSAVDWGAGTRSVFCSEVAEKLIKTVVLTDSTQSTSVTTNVNVAGLAFAVSSGRRYFFDFGVVYSASNTRNGIALTVTIPAVTKFGAVVDALTSSGDGVASLYRGHITASGDQVIGTGTQSAGNHIAELKGIIVPSADGTLQLGYAAEVSTSTVTVHEGSYGILLTLG